MPASVSQNGAGIFHSGTYNQKSGVLILLKKHLIAGALRLISSFLRMNQTDFRQVLDRVSFVPEKLYIMKKSLLLFWLLIDALFGWAQAPESFSYQGIARNASGQPLANQTMNIRLTIHSGTADGYVEYGEVRTLTTNSFGLFQIAVGSGGANTTQGNFASITWHAAPKFIQTEILLQGNQTYIDLGTVALQSVPYALHSREAAALKFPSEHNSSQNDFQLKLTNISNESNSVAASFNSKLGFGVAGYSESGTGIKASSDYGTAFEANGNLYLHGGNMQPGNGKVLTSDAFGNANWQTNLAKGFSFPIDTTVASYQAKPLLKIDKTFSSGTTAIFELKNSRGMGIYALSDSDFAVRATSYSPTHSGVFGGNNKGGNGVEGNAYDAATGNGIYGLAGSGNASAGVLGDGEFNSIGVKGISNDFFGVVGVSQNHIGTYGGSTNNIGVEGSSTNNFGVYGFSSNNHGVLGMTWLSGKAGVVGSAPVTGSIGVLAEAVNNALALDVNGALKIHGVAHSPASGKVLTSDAQGNATWKKPFELKKIGFSAISGLAISIPPNTWVRVPFKSEEYDGNNNFTPATAATPAVYVAPVSGLYHFDIQVAFKNNVYYAVKGNIQLVYKRNGIVTQKTVRYGNCDNASANANFNQKLTLSISGDFHFNAGDEIWVEVAQDNEAVVADARNQALAESTENFFTGHLVFED